MADPTKLTPEDARLLYSSISGTQYSRLPDNRRSATLENIYNKVNERKDQLNTQARPIFDGITSADIAGLTSEFFVYEDSVREKLVDALKLQINPDENASVLEPARREVRQGGKKRSMISKKFDKCVKSVRRTVKARRGSSKESAAIAICTTSVLHPRKRTIKRYRKGRLTTQRRR
jgi:hypothetical protein